MKKLVLLTILCVASVCLFSETLTISTSAGYDGPSFQALNKRLCLAFAAVGLDLQYDINPGIRGLVEANAGRIDGDIGRIPANISPKDYPNLVIIDEPIGTFSNIAYAVKPFKLNSIQDMVAQNLRVIAFSGLLWAETNVKPLIPPENWSAVPDIERGLLMLVNDHADIYIAPELDRSSFSQKMYLRHC